MKAVAQNYLADKYANHYFIPEAVFKTSSSTLLALIQLRRTQVLCTCSIMGCTYVFQLWEMSLVWFLLLSPRPCLVLLLSWPSTSDQVAYRDTSLVFPCCLPLRTCWCHLLNALDVFHLLMTLYQNNVRCYNLWNCDLFPELVSPKDCFLMAQMNLFLRRILILIGWTIKVNIIITHENNSDS